ncbi:hypothetical protein LEN26_007080 [Aphanomyces euteiches]|nr:hypothetical protein LEN26_007080 [Aphanomyces euteiches]
MYRRGIKSFSSIPLPQGFNMYEKARPDYPARALANLNSFLHLDDQSHTTGLIDVVEVGAGRGKLTKALKRVLPKQTRFVALEKDASLRNELQSLVPGVPVYQGCANETNLPDASVRNIVIGHAFHCMADANALGELHRVLVPNGRLSILLNTADFNSSPFMNEVEYVVKSFNAAYTPHEEARALQDIFHECPLLFSKMESREIRTVLTASVEGIVEYLMSTCVISDLSHRRQTDVRLSIARLIEMNPDVRLENGRRILDLPCVVEMHYVEKRQALETEGESTESNRRALQGC